MRFLRAVFVLGVSLALPSCQFFGSSEAKIKFSFRAAQRTPGLPSTVSGFDCLAINIMGHGIAPLAPSPNRKTMDEIIAGAYCTYPGIITGLIPTSGSVDLEITVPTGGQRVIQILGVKSPGGCSIGEDIRSHFNKSSGNAGDAVFPGLYEVGRIVEDIFGPKTINVPNTYDSSVPKEVRCSAGSCTWAMEQATPFAGGAGTAAAPYQICSATQFLEIANYLGNSNHFKLLQDIDFESDPMSPIGSLGSPFDGTLDGNGYTLKDIAVTTANPLSGLFAASSGTIKDLVVSGSVTNTSPSVSTTGLLVAVNSGTITSVSVSGTVTGTAGPVGGFVGQNSGTITGSSSSATVTSTSSATSMGGFVAVHSFGGGSIISCSATGNVTGSNKVGGFAGEIAGPVYTSSSTGTVTASASDVGGFAGLVGHVITRCGTTSTVNGTVNNIGGFAGRVSGPVAQITESFAKGNVQGNNNVGGFAGDVGSNATIRRSYSKGAVTGADSVGGFVGNWDNSGSIQTVYSNTTSVTATSNKGALIGNPTPTGTISDGYSSSAVTNSGDGITGTGLSPTQFILQASFIGWDFSTLWSTAGDTVPPFFQFE